MPDQIINDFADVGRDHKFVVVGSELFGHEARVLQLVVTIFVKTYGESLHRPAGVMRHQADDRARIHAARQEGAERHVSNQAYAHRFIEQRAQFLETLFFALRRFSLRLTVGKVPVLLDACAASTERQVMTRR